MPGIEKPVSDRSIFQLFDLPVGLLVEKGDRPLRGLRIVERLIPDVLALPEGFLREPFGILFLDMG